MASKTVPADQRQFLQSIKAAHGALSTWIASAQDGQPLTERSASFLQYTAAIIASDIIPRADTSDDERLMKARHFVGLVDSALWNFVGGEIETPPAVEDLVATADYARAMLLDLERAQPLA